MSLSFVVPREEWGKNKSRGVPTKCTKMMNASSNGSKNNKEPVVLKSKNISSTCDKLRLFRYRMEDALRSVTKAAIKEAWIKELKSELLNSDKLKAVL